MEHKNRYKSRDTTIKRDTREMNRDIANVHKVNKQKESRKSKFNAARKMDVNVSMSPLAEKSCDINVMEKTHITNIHGLLLLFDHLYNIFFLSSGCLTCSWSVWSHAVTPHSTIYHLVFVI